MSQNTKAAWARIRERMEALFVEYEKAEPQPHWLYGTYRPFPEEKFGSLNDEVQKEYRAGRITEEERNAMRSHIKTWLGDPDSGKGPHYGSGYFADTNFGGYEVYACGMWAASAAPMGETEHAIILSTLVVLEEEDDAGEQGVAA